MTCNKAAISGWEAFAWGLVGTARLPVSEDPMQITSEEPVQKFSESIDVYPNPAKGEVIKFKMPDNLPSESLISITNSKGELVFERKVNDSSAELKIGANLKPGFYYMLIRNGEQKTVKRILVE
jgi:hypothetical protein